jgi:tripartite-type tricarboxylate transporter receptor subunit TctC
VGAPPTPDGYTLLFTLESLVLAPYLYKKPGYDPLRDYAPVSYLFTVPTTVMVSTALPVSSLAELIALARSQPGKIASGSGGTGTISHLLLEMIKIAGNVDIQHIPYKGMAIAMTDFMAGQIQMIPASTTAAAAQVKSGKARVIAVASPKRAAMMPDVPTTHELGYPGMDALLWMGLLAPAGTPASIVLTLNSAAIRASNDPANAARYASQGIELVGSSPAEFQRFIASESSRLGKVIAAAKIQPE